MNEIKAIVDINEAKKDKIMRVMAETIASICDKDIQDAVLIYTEIEDGVAEPYYYPMTDTDKSDLFLLLHQVANTVLEGDAGEEED